MSKPDTPFPRHWLYYIVLKYVVIVGGGRCWRSEVAYRVSVRPMSDMPASASICSTPRCATARRPTASISRCTTSSPSRGMLDELGIDYVEGGYPGANPTDTQLFAEPRMLRHDLHRLRHDAAAGPLGLERSGPRGAARRQGRRDLLRRQVLGLSRAGRARDARSRKTSPRSATACAPPRRRAARCCSTASISSTATRPIRDYALACAKAAYEEGARWVVLCDTNGGTLPHEVEAIVARGGQAHSRRPCRHPRPQRHRAGGRQFARRGARRRAPDPGHAQRPRRALRQRQSRLDHPDLEAQAGVCRALRDRRLRRAARRASPMSSHALDEMAQPRAEPPRALCRRERVRHQGRHPRLRHRQGPGDLRACRARGGRQPAQAPGVRPGRHAPTCWPSSTASASRSTRTIRASRACSTRSRSARRSAMPTRRRTPRSSCWRGACSARCRSYFDVSHFDVNVEQRDQRHGRARHRRAWRWSR